MLRAHRQYSAGHTLTQQALLTAQDALRAYLVAFGPLGCVPAGRGLRFDFSPHAYEDDAAAEFGRTLTAAMVAELRVLAGVDARDLAVLADILHVPKPSLERAGGAGKLLRERGVQTISLLDLGRPAPGRGSTEHVAALVETLQEAPDQLAARLLDASGGDAQAATGLLRDLDRVVAAWPRAQRDEAWTLVAAAVVGAAAPLRIQLCRIITSALGEPWAASIAARWPPVLIAGIVTSESDPARPDENEIAPRLRMLHRGPARTAIPVTDAEAPGSREAARRDLERAAGNAALKTSAFARFLNTLARLDVARCDEGLRLVEREILPAVASADIETIAQILTGLAALAHRLPDARADLARVVLHRALSLAVRDLVARSLAERADDSHPLRRAMAAAPEEAVPLLLNLLADEDSLSVRREIVSLLGILARTQIPLLAQHLGDARWYVARNVVTVLAEMHDPSLVPHLTSALRHQDLRVRKEALQALGGLSTPDAVAALETAIHHPDPETRAAAAHWLHVAKTSGTDR